MKKDLEKKYSTGDIKRLEQLVLKDTGYDRQNRDNDATWTVSLSYPPAPSQANRTYTPSKALLAAAKKMFGGKFSVSLQFIGDELDNIVLNKV